MKRLSPDDGLAVTAPRTHLPHIEQAREDVGLTAREMEVADLLLKDATYQSKAIARVLGISKRTVELHLKRIAEKLGVETKVQTLLRWHDINRPQPAQALCPDCRRSSTP